MRIVVYDYTSEQIRGKVRSGLKKHGLHAQLSVFETELPLESVKNLIIREDSVNYRIAIFRKRRNAQPIKIGKHYDGSDRRVL